jgi:hypothetical protein
MGYILRSLGAIVVSPKNVVVISLGFAFAVLTLPQGFLREGALFQSAENGWNIYAFGCDRIC